MAFSCTIKFSLASSALYHPIHFCLTVAVQICQHSKGQSASELHHEGTVFLPSRCHVAAPETPASAVPPMPTGKDNGIEQTKEFCCLLKAGRHIDIFSVGSSDHQPSNAHGSPSSFHANTASVIPRRRKQPNAIHPLTFQHLLCSTVSVSPP